MHKILRHTFCTKVLHVGSDIDSFIGSCRACESRKPCFSRGFQPPAPKNTSFLDDFIVRLDFPFMSPRSRNMHFRCRGVAKYEKRIPTLARASKKYASHAGRERDFRGLRHLCSENTKSKTKFLVERYRKSAAFCFPR